MQKGWLVSALRPPLSPICQCIPLLGSSRQSSAGCACLAMAICPLLLFLKRAGCHLESPGIQHIVCQRAGNYLFWGLMATI